MAHSKHDTTQDMTQHTATETTKAASDVTVEAARPPRNGSRRTTRTSGTSNSTGRAARHTTTRAARQHPDTASNEPTTIKARPPIYDFRAIEEKWRGHWETSGINRVDLCEAARPYYNLMMFPYPSAEGLHVGNVYAYVGSDIHGRFMAARGYDVFEPMGFDAFGIHSENFAIKQGMHPAVLTARNVKRFRERQLKRIGNRFDWSHEVNTTDPRYYKWTQWIFTQLFNAGLAQRKRAAVNWCPKDKTVLADEQVIDGRCERCDSIVERRELEQWFLKITAYADRLLKNLATLDWSERVKIAQRNWIGRSEGAEIRFGADAPAVNHDGHREHRSDADGNDTITVFTTRPDTIYGVTFIVLASEHPLVDSVTSAEQRSQVAMYRAEAAAHRAADHEERAERPVSGVFTGAYVRHPLTGEALPIWVSDYVLMEYGTGAIMGVPAHDERDLAFARAFGLPVRIVIQPAPATPSSAVNEEATGGAVETVGAGPVSPASAGPSASAPAFVDPGVLIDSGPYTGMPSRQAAEAIMARVEELGIGKRSVHYQMRDWLISRQRYWGPPIPIVYCPQHGAVAVPEEQLPVVLPDLADYVPTGTGDSPLAKIPEFVATTCPICGGPARCETDVMDNFLDSAWYFLRYPSSDDDSQAWDPELTRKWLPVSMYIGGAEHSVLHLLYARFITMALHDLGKLSFEEPFTRFRAHGLILKDGAKISKNKGNVINPDEYLEAYGADVLRTYLMFMGPYEAGGDFNDRGIGGVVRFLDRVWRLVERHNATSPSKGRAGTQATHDTHSDAGVGARPTDISAMHATIKRVTEDIGALKYNTAIAALMEYTNALEGRQDISRAEVRMLLVLLAPFAPFVAEELWERLGEAGSVHQQPWPAFDERALHRERITLVVQVDGRLRDRIELPSAVGADEVRAAALASEKVQRAIAGRTVRDVIYVAGRLVNVVTAG